MAYWSLGLLLVSVTFLAYKHPPASRSTLPPWLLPGKRRALEDNKSVPSIEDAESTNGHTVAPKSSATVPTFDVFEPVEQDITPKASATERKDDVPIFALSSDEETQKPRSSQPDRFRTDPAPSNPTQWASTMPPPPKPIVKSTPAANGLMPPPARPVPSTQNRATGSLAPPPSAASSLRVPTTGPLPNRGPPANSQQRASGGLAPNGTAISTPNPRGKVLLSPGHSPMDWAALTKRGNLAGVDTFQRVTPSQLRAMTGRKGKPAWSSWQGKVYNITPYLPFHPGGESELMKGAGRDGTKLFMEVHPWVNWENMLGSCLVGVLVPEDYGKSDLEDMD